MNKIQEFNLQYGLTNISTNAFAKIDKIDQANDLAGKPKKNILEILKRFVTNPVAISALIVFIIVVLLAIILPKVSPYSPNDVIKATQTQSDSNFFNLPPKNAGWVLETVDDTKLQQIQNAKIPFNKITFNSIDLSLVGKTVIEYPKWQFINTIDNHVHNSIIGTNASGVDIWTRTWFGTGESLKLALLVATICVVIGTFFGSWIGLYFGSWIDIITLRLLGAFSSIPTFVWNILILMILPPGFWAEVIMFSLTGWISSFSISRTYIWKYINSDFMKAAKTLGVSKFGRIFKHALPNYIGIIAYSFVLQVPSIIEGEATLGFIGFSPNPSGASLGNVLNEMSTALGSENLNIPYILVPSLIIATITFSLKFVALGINDAVEPKYAKR